MIYKSDVVIIGAGITGCFAARTFSKYELNITVLEKREDACCKMTKSNMGIIYAGYDMAPGSLKARLCVSANEGMEKLCKDLDVTYLKTGSLMVAYGPSADEALKKKYNDGIKNNVKGLRLISGTEAEKMEPNIKKGITSALYSENTGVVYPWQLGLAAFENARLNGAEFLFNREVINIQYKFDSLYSGKDENYISVETKDDVYLAKAVINCAGINSDKIREYCNEPSIANKLSHADIIVYDEGAASQINHIIFHEGENKRQKFEIIPTLFTNILVGSTRFSSNTISELSSKCGIDELIDFTREFLPGLDQSLLINEFGGMRAEPVSCTNPAERIRDITVLDDNALISVIGLKTPGITIADELSKYIAELAFKYLGDVKENRSFNPKRREIPFLMDISGYNPLVHGELVCRCNRVFEFSIREAVKRGAATIDGVRRRTGAGMGRCQGSFCEHKIAEIIADELNIPVTDVTKNGPGSEILS